MMNLYAEFNKLITVLSEHEIKYQMVGGMAFSLHVAPHATVDIDIMIPESEWEGLLRVLQSLKYHEFTNRKNLTDNLQLRHLTRIIGKDHFDLDTVVIPDNKEQYYFKENKTFKWDNFSVPVISPQLLIELKRQRGSKRDEVDIEELEMSINNKPHDPPPSRSKEDPDYAKCVIKIISDMIRIIYDLKKGAKTRRLLNPQSK